MSETPTRVPTEDDFLIYTLWWNLGPRIQAFLWFSFYWIAFTLLWES